MQFGAKGFELSNIQAHSAQPDVIDRRVFPLENFVSLTYIGLSVSEICDAGTPKCPRGLRQ